MALPMEAAEMTSRDGNDDNLEGPCFKDEPDFGLNNEASTNYDLILKSEDMGEVVPSDSIVIELDKAVQMIKKCDLSCDEGSEDSLGKVLKKQEAALRKLESIHGSGYGKPPPGSKSEARALKYQASCLREIVELCGLISEKGYTDQLNNRAILFSSLFNYYRFISDKCCGLLLRARRYKLVSFEGEMLFQGKDDNTVITLLRPFKEIHGHFVKTKQLIKPEEVYVPTVRKVRKKVARKVSRGNSFRRLQGGGDDKK